jgi:RNA polymerase-binding protein DksA
MTLLDDAREVLLRRRATLRKLNSAIADEKEDAAAKHEIGDQVDLANEREADVVTFKLSETEKEELLAVESAIARIEDGTYGRCESCGRAIGRQRLKALPEAKLCLDCSSARGSRK